MLSLPLLRATALVLFGSGAWIRVACEWLAGSAAFNYKAFRFQKSHGSKKKTASVLIESVTRFDMRHGSFVPQKFFQVDRNLEPKWQS